MRIPLRRWGPRDEYDVVCAYKIGQFALSIPMNVAVAAEIVFSTTVLASKG
jgi:hypothetical protein